MERVCVFVDSGNFYHLVLKKLGIQDLDFNFDRFVKFLVGEREIIEEGKRFYVGTVRERKNRHENKKAISNQTTLFTSLFKLNWVIKTSKLRTRIEKVVVDDRVIDYQKLLDLEIKEIKYERSREKGIDVKLATDLIIGAMDDKYDSAVLVSSDTDLVPAIDLVRYRFGKKVEYIGFSILGNENHEYTRPIKRMIYSTDIQRVLVREDIEPFIIKKLF